ncbi:molydopterin dinucleotide-binding region [Mycolicibacterium gilvum]|uniref:Molydopterin dinucleotide-binding region n=1 Tax=Mycolicibacterium gilvum TaxID=1804 RepID=A0A378SI71_9MYCO|nr:molydopterin dinucleotide-binding region [Mycolicibacterium gilvum]
MEHRITCPLCEAMCGLKITVSDGVATSARGNADDVWSRGHLCPKGASLHQIHHDPDRLRLPLVRSRSGEHVQVSWDDAFTETERVLRPVIDRYGARAVTVYLGNPVAHNLGLQTYIGALVGMAGAVGMPAYYTPGTVDQWPLNVVSALLFGGMWNAPIPDLDRTDHLMMLGANPSASQGSMLSAPDIMGRLAAIRARGGTVVVVDPRRTPTARRASEWVPVHPGTDALLLFAILHTLAERGWIRRPPHLQDLVAGLDDIVGLAARFSPERVEVATGVPAGTVRRLAADLAAAERPVLYSRIGACTQEFGTLATWLVFVLNVALGSVDAPGGALFPKAAVWSPMFMKPPDQDGPGWRFGRFHSRVRRVPEVLGQFPVSCLAEEIDTPGDGQIRGLITVAGNPVISAPGSRRLDAALSGLDAMISVDNWLNETSRHAHVVLPGLSPLERAHCDDLYWMYSVASCVKWTEPVFPTRPDRPQEWEILLRLAGAVLGTAVPDVDVRAMDDLYTQGIIHTACQADDTPLSGRDPGEVFEALDGVGPERMTDLGIRVGPWGDDLGRRPGGLTLDEVRRHPDGLRLAELEGGRLPDILTTPSRRIELLHPLLEADIPRLVSRIDRSRDDLVLTSRRHLRSNNSWMHNVAALMRGKDRCTLLIHPDDALRHDVADGGQVEVSTIEGSIVVVARCPTR